MTSGIGNRMAIIGVGNPMMADDGIGPRLISELEGSVSGVDLIDIGTGGMQLVHVLARYDSVVIIDAAEMGLAPREYRIFSPGDVVSFKETRSYSLHDWDLMRSIEISRQLGEAPEKILIFAVQPGALEMREGLSAEVQGGLADYVRAIRLAMHRGQP
jgi:hydrogenase maturation protease